MTAFAPGADLRARVRAFLEEADDRLNPFVVKEARQLVRSRAVVGGLHLLLGSFLVLMAWRTASVHEDGRHAGEVAFSIFQAGLALVCVYGIPLYVGVRMAAERTSMEGMDLLRGTTMDPSAVVLGKWFSGLLLGLLAVSAAAPFIALCYFLRGVSLAMLFQSLWMDGLLLAVGTQFALLIGSVGKGWGIKIFGALLYVVLSPCVAGITAGIAMANRPSGAGAGMWVWTVVASVLAAVAWAIAWGLSLVAMQSATLASAYRGNSLGGRWTPPSAQSRLSGGAA